LAEKKAAEAKAQEWEKTSRDLAERYNTDMITVGLKHWELKRPDLFEKVKEELLKAETFEQFTDISEKILKENPVEGEKPVTEPEAAPQGETPATTAAEAAPAGEPAKKDTEATPAPEKDEAAPAKEESTPAAAEAPLVENAPAKVHPQIEHARRARANGLKYRR
jgi:hypothetical protein